MHKVASLVAGRFAERLALVRQAAEHDDLPVVHDLLRGFEIGFRPEEERPVAAAAAQS